MASGQDHFDPTVRNLTKLQSMAKQHNLPEEIQQQIGHCLLSYYKREDFCDKMTSPTSDEVCHIIDKTMTHPWEKAHEEGKIPAVWKYMLSGKLEGNFLKTIVSMNKAKKVLEIGLFTGCSALSMAEALPPDGTVTACEILPYLQDFARTLVDKSPHGCKIRIEGGPALTTLEELANTGEQFDVIFIDADKENYLNYYQVIMDRDILSPGGTIIADNAMFFGSPYCTEDVPHRLSTHKTEAAIYEFDDFVSKDVRVYQVLVPLRDGVLLIRRKSDVEGAVNDSDH